MSNTLSAVVQPETSTQLASQSANVVYYARALDEVLTLLDRCGERLTTLELSCSKRMPKDWEMIIPN